MKSSDITPSDYRPRTFTITLSGEDVMRIGQSLVFRGCSIVSEKREYRHSNPSDYYRARRHKKIQALWNFKEWRKIRNK